MFFVTEWHFKCCWATGCISPRKTRTRNLIQLGALFEIAKLDQRDPAELLGVLLKTAEIHPNDEKWQIWKELGMGRLNHKKEK